MDLNKAFFNGDSRSINKALKTLYLDIVINAKVNELSRAYNLKNKEPDDILQEAVIILFDAIQRKKFRGESNIKTYLIGICRNLIRDSVKKKEILKFQEHFQEGTEKIKVPEYDHFKELEKTEEENLRDTTLLSIINKMDEKCRKALTLYYYEKIKMTKLAEQLQLKNDNQAKKVIYRCRKKLRIIIQSNPSLIQLLNPQS